MFRLASCFLFGCLSDCYLTGRIRHLAQCLALVKMRQIKHAVSVVALVGCIYFGLFINSGANVNSTFSATERYGPKLRQSPLLSPFLCFRVVTRGLYPDLVIKNVQQNIQTCEKVGIQNYIIEVVSDESIRLKNMKRCRQIVVPRDYKTKSGSLFKARALQYALEPGIDTLVPGDWIVHLDEETVLTEDAVVGIVNFAVESVHSFGQGVITYGNGKIINWITTLADSVRVGIDYGSLRFSLSVLHKPVFSWKGSFIVADSEAEKQISYDHGPEASITEDCFFACVAYSRGHSFGFVDGTMFEQSTFNFADFVRQRRRWTYGILLTALSNKIPLKYKVGPILMSSASCFLPLNILMIVLGLFWPIPYLSATVLTLSFNLGTVIYLFILGTMKTFSVQRHGIWKSCLLVFASLFCGMVAYFLETVAAVLVFWFPRSSMNNFYIVNKEIVLDDLVKV
ncbi:hypothetical protein Btru_055500 [Bulinus truncatus]|nr:hypothetical protein Btru_055500 [Bulinus truncatus]